MLPERWVILTVVQREPYSWDERMREVPLTRGRVAIVDDEDFDRVSAHKWHVVTDTRHHNWYGVTNIPLGKGRYYKLRLHRFIVNAPDELDVDHIDHDTLNCRRSNLRLATDSQNRQNLAGAQRNSLTGVRGVHFEKRLGKYRASIKVNHKTYYFGWYGTLDEAAKAVADGRRQMMTHAPECGAA